MLTLCFVELASPSFLDALGLSMSLTLYVGTEDLLWVVVCVDAAVGFDTVTRDASDGGIRFGLTTRRVARLSELTGTVQGDRLGHGPV